jgi:hypothetical protein
MSLFWDLQFEDKTLDGSGTRVFDYTGVPPAQTILTSSGFGIAGTLTQSFNYSNVTSSIDTELPDRGPVPVVSFLNMTLTPAPVVTIASRHDGERLFRGKSGAYTLTVNADVGPILPGLPVTVGDTLPVGVTASTIGGDGWDCDLQALTCTRFDGLNAGQSYPPITINVIVAANAPLQSTYNSATVSLPYAANLLYAADSALPIKAADKTIID